MLTLENIVIELLCFVLIIRYYTISIKNSANIPVVWLIVHLSEVAPKLVAALSIHFGCLFFKMLLLRCPQLI